MDVNNNLPFLRAIQTEPGDRSGLTYLVQVSTFLEWRSAALTLLSKNIPPHLIYWASGKHTSDLLTSHPPETEKDSESGNFITPTTASPFHISRKLKEMLETASCFCDPTRWEFLYKILWRWQHGEKEVMSAADVDGGRLYAMTKAVQREEHDMRAYVRFRQWDENGSPEFIAWYEPTHDVLQRVAHHFSERMGSTTWLIATPKESAYWNGKNLQFTDIQTVPGPHDIADDGESLWLSYYRSIFNPSRLNTKVMQSHIPGRFWKNLPEGKIVTEMVAAAKHGAMRIGQAEHVGKQNGSVIPIEPAMAMPQRDTPNALSECRRCSLWRNATQPVAGNGPDGASIMLIGEQPGDMEDLAGKPFVGPAGQLLEQALSDAELERETLYITNAVKHFKWEPRGKRRLHKTPAQQEIISCRYWLDEEIARIQPRIIVAMGSTALKSLLDRSDVQLNTYLGQTLQYADKWILATYHPAYVLRLTEKSMKQDAFNMMVSTFNTVKKLC